MDPVICKADLPAYLLQGRACIVADLLLADDAPFNLGRQNGKGFDLFKIRIQTICKIVRCLVASVGFRTVCSREKLADAQQFSGS